MTGYQGSRTPGSIRGRPYGLLLLAAAALLLAAGDQASLAATRNRKYTTAADFRKGTLFNTAVSNRNNSLVLSATTTTFPVMWIANAGEDTLSKIDTDTGKELARYRTWFGPAGQPGHFPHRNNAYAGAAPSRTGVDREGNVYVANRHFDNRPAEVLKILAEGGIDRNGNGKIDTSTDANGNGKIDANEILPMGDTNGNGRIDMAEVQDERVAWISPPVGAPGRLGRSLALDGDGNVWVGLFSAREYYKLSGIDGKILAGPIDVSPNTPYGGIVDGNGFLWGASLSSTLLRLNTNNQNVKVFNHGSLGSDYGIAIGNNKVYQASPSGQSFIQFDPDTETFSAPAANKFRSLGIATDARGDIFVGNITGGVTKFRPDGTVIWSAAAQPGTGEVRGVVVDARGDVWLIHRTSDNISKHRGSDGAALGVFPVGNRPYTYTDATGLTGFGITRRSGRWTIIQNGGAAGVKWGRVRWNTEREGRVPQGASITAEARAANSRAGLETQSFVPVENGKQFNLAGRFIEVRMTLTANADRKSPVLSDVTISALGGAPRRLSVDCSVARHVLWPAGSQMVRVGLKTRVTGAPRSAVRVEVFADEPEDEPTKDEKKISTPDADRIRPGRLRLRSERFLKGDGRVYLIVTRVTRGGQSAFDVCTVVVPWKRNSKGMAMVRAQARAAERFARTHNGAPPRDFVRIGRRR